MERYVSNVVARVCRAVVGCSLKKIANETTLKSAAGSNRVVVQILKRTTHFTLPVIVVFRFPFEYGGALAIYYYFECA